MTHGHRIRQSADLRERLPLLTSMKPSDNLENLYLHIQKTDGQ